MREWNIYLFKILFYKTNRARFLYRVDVPKIHFTQKKLQMADELPFIEAEHCSRLKSASKMHVNGVLDLDLASAFSLYKFSTNKFIIFFLNY